MADGPIAAGGARRSSSATLNPAATVWETDGSNAAPPAPAGAPEARIVSSDPEDVRDTGLIEPAAPEANGHAADDGDVVEALAATGTVISIEELREAVAARGRERGFVTSDDLLEGLPLEDLTPEQVEEFLTQVEEHLRQEGIEVVEARAEDLEAEADPVASLRLPREDDLLKAPTNDPVRMYLKEIGKVPLLTAAQEVDLAMRIEAGEFATDLIAAIDAAPAKVDQKQFRRVVDSVVMIREHQLDPEKRLRNEGIGRERAS